MSDGERDKKQEQETLEDLADAVWEQIKKLSAESDRIEQQTLRDFEDLLPSLKRGAQSRTKEVQHLYDNAIELIGDVSGRAMGLWRSSGDSIQRYDRLDLFGKITAYRAAVQAVDPDKIADEQILRLLKEQQETILNYLPVWKLVAGSVSLASWRVSIGYRDLQAACMDRRHPSQAALTIGLGLLKNFTVDMVTKHNPAVGPLIGAVEVLAENVQADVDRKLQATHAAIAEVDKVGALRDGLAGLQAHLTDQSRLAEQRSAVIQEMDLRFGDAYLKSMSILSTARKV